MEMSRAGYECAPFVSLAGGGKVLAIGAHWDDVLLGCLGTLLKLKRDHDYQVSILVLCTSYSTYYGCPQPGLETKTTAMYSHMADTFGFNMMARPQGFPAIMDNTLRRDIDNVANLIATAGTEFKDFGVVLSPPVDDTHPDHSVAGELIRQTFRHPGQIRLEYEIKRYTDRHFVPNLFVDLSVAVPNAKDQPVSPAETKIKFLSDMVVNGKDGEGRALDTAVRNSNFLFSAEALRARLLVNALDYADNRDTKYGEAFRGRISI